MDGRSGLIMILAALAGGSSAPADVSSELAFKDARRCEFRASGEAMLRRMLHGAGKGSAMAADREVGLKGERLAVHFREERDPATNFVTYGARVDLPTESRWNGLGLVSVAVEEFIPPEIDGLSARELAFSDPVERVRTVFNGLGVPFGGGSEAFIDKPLGGCEGSIRLEARGGGTVLRCEWGC